VSDLKIEGHFSTIYVSNGNLISKYKIIINIWIALTQTVHELSVNTNY
jgi:hypothetical protein